MGIREEPGKRGSKVIKMTPADVLKSQFKTSRIQFSGPNEGKKERERRGRGRKNDDGEEKEEEARPGDVFQT